MHTYPRAFAFFATAALAIVLAETFAFLENSCIPAILAM
jgi:hypothetical protein